MRAAAGLLCAALVVACGARSSLESSELAADAPDRRCGNGLVEGDEQCDDANRRDEDACLASCVLARCGDGVVADFEGCDDGNTAAGDGCQPDCRLPRCGDGLVDPGEQCDGGGVTTADCTPLCRRHRCGDGVVESGVEACDEGAANEDRPALLAIQGELRAELHPVPLREGNATSFYDYRSASSHTGLESVGQSRLFFTLDTTGVLALFTIHGIDGNDGGPEQAEAQVFQRFEGLPSDVGVLVSDDQGKEFSMQSEGVAIGDWKFERNTDGGVLGPMPFPGSWTVLVTSELGFGVDTWQVLDASDLESPIGLDPTAPALLVAQAEASSCDTSCKIPRCGDGRLDGGERCDDGNEASGDGCSADCSGVD